MSDPATNPTPPTPTTPPVVDPVTNTVLPIPPTDPQYVQPDPISATVPTTLKLDNSPIIFSALVTSMVIITVGAITWIQIALPSQDNAALIGTILSVVIPTTAALMALVKANYSASVATSTHLMVNSVSRNC